MTTDSTLSPRRIAARPSIFAGILLVAAAAPASATTFSLDVNFGPQLTGPSSSSDPALTGANLKGTFDFNFFPLLQQGPHSNIPVINFDLTITRTTAASTVVTHLDGTAPPALGLVPATMSLQDNDGFDILMLSGGDAQTGSYALQLLFPTSFDGTGDPLPPDPGAATVGNDLLTDGLVFIFPGVTGQVFGPGFQHLLPVAVGTEDPTQNPPPVTDPAPSVSEPSSLGLVASGLALFGWVARRRGRIAT